MSFQSPSAIFDAAKSAALPLRRNRAERVFDLHPALHVAMFAGFGLFLAILAAGLMSHELSLPMAICFVFLAAAFATPAAWARVAGQQEGRKQSWAEFMEEGVETATGRLGGGEAIVQVLILPALLVLWALAIIAIKAAV
ncbi:hypothetical protein [Sphingomonas sp.]|jgi:glucan phosphoethanolaminetransferase (alkaline phosphatase superfamily)|uniref:hypothetical protein n=1 Tax=Sphingomonas sp. TaxID=28214 RepID=UPI002DF0D24C|nr:hypothetical protein [Sphingomonas sp.]